MIQIMRLVQATVQKTHNYNYRADIIIHYYRYRSIYHATKTKELTFGYSLLPIEVHLPSYTKHKASSLFKMGVGS